MQKSISIIGCGWLGLPLAGHLLSWHFTIKGTTTSPEKVPMLRKWGIRPFLFDLDQPEKWNEKLFNSSHIIIAIPPSKSVNYLENLSKLLTFCTNKKVLFVSSTSVYGTSVFPVTEFTKTLGATESKLVAAEEMIRETCPQATIIRMAGLVGPGRHPGRFLAGKTAVAGAKIPVNFISLEDAVMLCAEVIGQEKWGFTFNAANPQHPSKEEYYQFACETGGYAPPKFTTDHAMDGFKVVVGDAIVAALRIGYQEIPWQFYIKSLSQDSK